MTFVFIYLKQIASIPLQKNQYIHCNTFRGLFFFCLKQLDSILLEVLKHTRFGLSMRLENLSTGIFWAVSTENVADNRA